MCLLIANKAGFRTPENYLKVAAEVNNDGIGAAYSIDNKLIVKKDFASFDHFYAWYQNVPIEANLVSHFRLISAGIKSEENNHPSMISEDLCMFLNGTLDFYKFKDSELSDTNIFCNMTLKPFYEMDKEFYKKSFIKRVLTDHVKSNRILFFNNLGEWVILNEDLGYWDEDSGSWYSNIYTKNRIENEQKKVSVKNKHKFARPIVYNPTQYTLPGANHGGNKDSKKKYFLCGDPYYNVLAESEIEKLKQKHRLNTRKLKQRGIIAKLSTISDVKLYEAFLKKGEKMSDHQSEQLNNPVLKQLNLPTWEEKWGKLSEEQQRYIIAFNLQDKLLDVKFIFPPPADNQQNKTSGPNLTPEEEKQLDEIGRIMQEE